MQEGGEVDPPLLDSQLAGTSSEFTSQPQVQNLDLGIPDRIDPKEFQEQMQPGQAGYYVARFKNWENLNEKFGYGDFIESVTNEDPDMLLVDSEPDEPDFNQWMADNAPEEILPPEPLSQVEQMSPLLVNVYNSNVEAYKNNLNARNEAINSYNENAVKPYNEYFEKRDAAQQQYMRDNLRARKVIADLERKATRESIDKMHTNADQFGRLDLGLLEIKEKSGVSFKTNDGVVIDRGDVVLSDLYDGTADELIATLDEEATSFREQGLAEIDSQIEEQREEVENKRPKGGKPYFGAQAELKTLEKEREEYLANESYGMDIAARKYFENYVLESMALTEEEWEIQKPEGESYKDYILNLESKIYGDLLYNKEASEFAESLGMDGFGLILDDDVAIGERQSRRADAALSWRQGGVQLAGMIDASAVATGEILDLAAEPYITGDASWWEYLMPGVYDLTKAGYEYMTGETTDNTEQIREALSERDEERKARMVELENQKNQFAVNGRQLDLFGPDAINNENIQIEQLSYIYNQARRDMVFNETINPAITSMPVSLTTMGVALATTPFTGGSSLVAAGAGGGAMMYGVMNRTYYDSFTNPDFYAKNEDGSVDWDTPLISETQRHGMSAMIGGAEGAGEMVGTLVTFGVGKFALTPARFSPYSILKGSPKVSGTTAFSPARKVVDYGLGLTYSMGVGASTNALEEGATEIMQMATESAFSGKKYTRAEYAQGFMSAAKIGAVAGAPMTGGAWTLGNAKASIYERVFKPEVYNSKVADTYYHQLTNSGFFYDGVSKANLAELKEQIDIIRKETAKGGAYTNLTQEQSRAINRAKELSEQLNVDKVRDVKTLEILQEKGRGDLLAEMVAIDNRLLYIQAMTEKYSQNEDGQWLDKDGHLTDDPTKMDLYKMNVNLTDKKKLELKVEQRVLLNKMQELRERAEAGAIDSPGYKRKERDKGIGNWRSKIRSGWTTATIEDTPTGEFGDLLNKFTEAASGQATVITWDNKEQFKKVTGDENILAFYKEASNEERARGINNEMHVYVGEGQTKAQLEKDIYHEFGHHIIGPIVSKSGVRERLVDEILRMDNENVKNVVHLTRIMYDKDYAESKGYDPNESDNYEQDALEEEIIVAFLTAIGTGELSESDITQGFERWGLGIMRQAGALGFISDKAVLRDTDSIVRIAAKYANFINEKGGVTGIRTADQAQAANRQRKAEEAIDQAETSEGAGKAAKKFSYLDNTKIYYTEVISQEGKDAITRVTSVREKTADLSDYNHFRNLYAKMTGNGANPSRMEDIYFIKDGRRFDVKPPRPKTDKQGNILQMEVPKRMTYNERKLARALETQEYEDMLAQERADIMTEVGDLWKNNDKNISSYTNLADFNPTIRDEFDLGPRSRTIEQLNSDIEDQVIAKKNIQALIDSDITEQDLKALAGRLTKIGRKSNPSIFNMSGLRKAETHLQKADRLSEAMETEGPVWQLLPKDSPSYKNRITDLRLATPEELQYASDRFDRIEDEPLDGDLFNIDGLEPTGKARKDDKKIKYTGELFTPIASENFKDFLEGKIPSGVVENFDSLKALLKEFDQLDSKGEFVWSLHNVDRTKVGKVILKVHNDVFEANLSGGPLGNSVAAMNADKSDGVFTTKDKVAHNTSTLQSSKNISTYAKQAKEDNSAYVLSLQLLTPKNSFGNPQVFKIAADYTYQYLTHPDTPEGAKEAFVKSLNGFFENQAYKTNDGIRVSYGSQYQAIAKRIDGITSGTGNLHVNSIEGALNLLQRIASDDMTVQKITNMTNFKDRGGFVNRLFKPKVGLGKFEGFVSEDDFLKAVNEKEYEGVEAGAVVNATLVDVDNADITADVSEDIARYDEEHAKFISFNYGVTGHIGTLHFSKPLSRAGKKELHARAATSGAKKASRKLPGRIYAEGNSSWEKSSPTAYGLMRQKLAIKLQDSFSDVMLLQQDIAEFKKKQVPESQDFEAAMDVTYGMTRTDYEALQRTLEEINQAQVDAGLTAEQVSDYLYAKHAEERNDYIDKKRPDLENGGSGMTNEEAAEIIEELETPEMIAISKLVYRVVKNTRETMVQSGLEKAETIEHYENLFKNYVPLNGLSTDQMDDKNSTYPTGGSGFAIYGRATKAAKGRASKTGVNIVANIIMQNAMVHQTAQKNLAMMKLYNLVKNNPNEGVWNIYTSKEPKQKFDPDKGETVGMTVFEMKADERMVPIRVNGDQHFIFFKEANYARTLNGATQGKVGLFGKVMSGPMNLMRGAFIQYNPVFFAFNYFRDVQSGIYNGLAEVDREGGILEGYDIKPANFTKDVVTGSWTTLKALLGEGAFGKELSQEIKEMKVEWENAGGRTGYLYSESINNLAERMRVDAGTNITFRSKVLDHIGLKSEFDTGIPKNFLKRSSKTAPALKYVDRVFKSPKMFFEWVESINEAFENSIRLSAYIEARKRGVSSLKAAQLSKNITVNFNKSGEITPALNSQFLFLNAAIQGTSRFARTFESLKKELPNNPDETTSWRNRITSSQKLAAGAVLFSFTQALVSICMSGRDEEDGELWYKKYSEYEKERNLLICTGQEKDDFVKVPLGYGYNIFNNLGVMLAEVSTGVRDYDEAMLFLANSAHSSFSPIAMGHSEKGFLTSVGKTVTPSYGKAIADAMVNETYFGTKVYQEQYPFGAGSPESQLSFRSPDWTQDAFVALNEMTGGTENISAAVANPDGGIDVNFDPYYYVMQSYWGGAGDFVIKTGGLARSGYAAAKRKHDLLAKSRTTDEFVNNLFKTKSEDLPAIRYKDVPMVGKIYGGPSRFYDFNLYEKNRKEIMQFENELKKGTDMEVKESLQTQGIYQLSILLDQSEDALKLIRESRKEARKIEDYIEKSRKMYYLTEEERKVVSRFNGYYYQLRGQYTDPKPQGIIPINDIRKAIGTDE